MKHNKIFKRLTSILLVLLLIFGDLGSAVGSVKAYADGVEIPINIIDYTDPANHPANNDMFASTVPGQNLTGNTSQYGGSGSSVSADSGFGVSAGSAGSVSATPGTGNAGVGSSGSTYSSSTYSGSVSPDGTISTFPDFGTGDNSGELDVSELVAWSRYAVVNGKPMKYTVSFSGGTAPYHVHFAVRLNGDICFEQREDIPEAGETGFEWSPVLYGTHDVAVTVKDATGKSVSRGRTIPVAVWETEDFDEAVSGVELSGNWAEDVVRIATSQLGRGENKRNFIIDEDGTSYYSMYSHWCYDDPFMPWESAFVLYCMDKAGVPEDSFPRSAAVGEWISTLELWGLFMPASDYEPVAGDIAFFANGSTGIVAEVRDGVVYIIDGDREDCDTVARYAHAIGDSSINGYGRLGTVQTNPSTYVPEPKALTELSFTVTPQTSQVGDEVTFSAVIPADVEPERYLWRWQMSPDGENWRDIEDACEPTWTVTTNAAHYLNYIRVVAEPMPRLRAFRLMAAPQTAAEGAEAPVAARAMLMSVPDSDTEIYWNPSDNHLYNEDGDKIVAAGNDDNSGANYTVPVKSLGRAVALAKSEGKTTIVCMNRYVSHGDDSLAGAGNTLTMVGYDGGGISGAAHQGQYISSNANVFSVANLKIDGTGNLLAINGGQMWFYGGNAINCGILLTNPSTNSLPIKIMADGANAANGGKYTVSFSPDASSPVGIAQGGLDENKDKLQLTQALTDRGWALTEINGNTYAHIAPQYDAIYVDGVNGNDTKDGNTWENPVRSFAKAVELLKTYNSETVNTIYVMGAVNLVDNANGDPISLPEGTHVQRHSSCTGPMFRVAGDSTFNFPIDNSGSTAAIFEVNSGTLSIGTSAVITNSTGYLADMAGGSLSITNFNAQGKINTNGIARGSAASVVLSGSTLSSNGSNPLVDVTVSGSFTATGATLTGPADNTLILGGTASLTNTSVNDGAGSVKLSSGSLTVEKTSDSAVNTKLNKITAAGAVTVENCTVETINNTGSATTLDTASVSTLSSAGTVNVNSSAISGNVTVTGSGSSLTLDASTVSGTITASGTVTVQNKSATAAIDAAGAVTVTGSSTVAVDNVSTTTAIAGDSSVTVENSTVTGNISSGTDTTVTGTDKTTHKLTGNISAGGEVTVDTATVTGTVSAGGLVSITDADIDGTISGYGTASAETAAVTVSGSTTAAIEASDDVAVKNSSAVTGDITTGGDLTVTGSTVTGNVEADGNVTVSSSATLTGSLTTGGDLNLTTSSTVNGAVSIGGDATVDASTVNDVTENVPAFTVKGDAQVKNGSTLGSISVSGNAVFSGDATNTVTTANVATADITNTNITTTLTATGNVALHSGSVSTLKTTANVTGHGGSIDILELNGANSVFTVGGSYATVARDITLGGAKAKIQLHGAPAGASTTNTNQISLTVTREENGRVVVEGMGNCDARKYLVDNEPTQSVYILKDGRDEVLLKKAESENNIILGAPEAVYVNTEAADGHNGFSATTPFNTFTEAVNTLKTNPLLPRVIYVVSHGDLTAADATSLATALSGYTGDPITIVAYNPTEINTLFNVKSGATFNSNYFNFDGTGMPAGSTLINVESTGSFTAAGISLTGAATAIKSAGTTSVTNATVSATGTAIEVSGGTANVTGTVSAAGPAATVTGGTATLGGTVSAAGIGVDVRGGSFTLNSGSSLTVTGDNATGVKVATGATVSSLNGAISLSSGTGLDMADGAKVLGGTVTIDIAGAGTGIKMPGTASTLGSADSKLSGTITLGSGTGLEMTGGTAYLAASINVKNADSLGVSITGGTLTYSGTIRGENAMTITGASTTVNFSGYTYPNTGSSTSADVGKVTMTAATLNVTGGTMSSLTQSGGTTTVSGGTVSNMSMDKNGSAKPKLTVSGTGYVSKLTQNDGATTATGTSGDIGTMTMNAGTFTLESGAGVSRLNLNKGAATVTGGTASNVYITGSPATSTLDITGGTVSYISQSGGRVELKDGNGHIGTIYISKSDSEAKFFANGGSLGTAQLIGDNSILHTNGKCDIDNVEVGRDYYGQGAYIALSGEITENNNSNKINITDVSSYNYREGYSIVRPDSTLGSDYDTTVHLDCFRFGPNVVDLYNLAAGPAGTTQAKDIVLVFDGVFIDTENGSDDFDGLSAGNAVQTFEKAAEVMDAKIQREDDPSTDNYALRAIYVVNRLDPSLPATATVRGDDELRMDAEDSSGKYQVFVTSYVNSCDTLVIVPAGSSFTVENARIDGCGANGAVRTNTVMDISGSFTVTNGSVINGRSTNMLIRDGAKVELIGSSVIPQNSSATNIKMSGGQLNIDLISTVKSGKTGLDISGGTATISGEFSSNTTGINITGGSVNVTGFGRISGGSTGVNVSGGTVTMGGTIKSATTGMNITGSSPISADGSTGGVRITGTVGSSTSNERVSYGVAMSGGEALLTGKITDCIYTGLKITGGSLTQSAGSSITKTNSNEYDSGTGAVNISGTGTYTLSGGTISANKAGKADYSGGVTVNGGSFVMTGGTIGDTTYYNKPGTNTFQIGNSNTTRSNGGGIAVLGGTASISGGTVRNNHAGYAKNDGGCIGYGGGIYVGPNGSLTMTGGTVHNNRADNGGGIYWSCGARGSVSGVFITDNMADTTSTDHGNGGGIYISGPASSHSHSFTGCTVTGNYADRNGGGIYNNCASTLDLSGITDLSNNFAQNGGAVYMVQGALTLGSSKTLTGNYATSGSGGAVYLKSGSVTGENITFTGSYAGGNGGVLYVESGTATLTGATMSKSGTGTSATGNSAQNGGAVYLKSGTVDLTDASISGASATNGSGGAVYVENNSNNKLTLSGATVSGTASNSGGAVYLGGGSLTALKNDSTAASITGSVTGTGDGGAVYINSGSANLSGATLSGAATNGNGGALATSDSFTGSVDLSSATLTGNAANTAKNAVNGGGLYMGGGSLTAPGLTANSGLTASGNGGAVYLSADITSANLDGATLSGSAANGGGLYMGGGSVSLLNSATVKGTANGTDESSAAIGASAIALDGGSLALNGSVSKSAADAARYTLRVASAASLDHIGGTIYSGTSGSTTSALAVWADGSYTITLPDAYTKGEIYLNNNDHPLVISTDSSEKSSNTFNVRVSSMEFASCIIVDGTSTVKAELPETKKGGQVFDVVMDVHASGTVITPYVHNEDIIGGSSPDVYWDPSGNKGNDNNSGDTEEVPVKTFEVAKTKLADKGRAGRIIQMSTCNEIGDVYKVTDGKTYAIDGKVTEKTDGTQVAEPWNAKVVRYNKVNPNNSVTSFTFTMFSGSSDGAIVGISNIIISGEASDGSGNVAVGYNMVAAGANFDANNVWFINHNASQSAMSAVSCLGGTFTNCKFIDNYVKGWVRGGDEYQHASGAALRSTGTTRISNCEFSNNVAETGHFEAFVWGAAAYFLNGGVTVENSSFVGNKAALAGATSGAAMYVDNGSQVSISGSVFSDNSCISSSTSMASHGGAIYVDADSCTIASSSFYGNKVETQNCAYGGAVYATDSLTITGSTFTNNASPNGHGGAIYANNTLAISGSTFTNNKTGNFVGPGQDDNTTYGGAVYSNAATEITNCTFTGNGSIDDGYGGAVYSVGSLTVTGGTFQDNDTTYGGALYSSAGISITGGSYNGNIADGGKGGAVYSGGGSINITGGSYEKNTASYGDGGAVYATDTLTITGGSFTSNSAANGGALYSSAGISITGGSYNGNTANGGKGGAVYSEGDVYISDGSDLEEASTVESSVFTNNTAADGGAVYSGGSSNGLGDGSTVLNATFTNNTATGNGGAIWTDRTLTISGGSYIGNQAVSGGAVYVTNSFLTITGGSFTGNQAETGGAVYHTDAGGVSITDGTFTDNYASSSGGAVWSYNKTITVTGGSFTGNQAESGNGGALCAGPDYSNGSIEIKSDPDTGGAVFENNTAGEYGGAVYASYRADIEGGSFTGNSAGSGGAVYVSDGTSSVTDSSFTDNSAASMGGAVCFMAYEDDLAIEDSSFTGNSAGSGGAVFVSDEAGDLTVTGSSFNDNAATSGNGGAVYTFNVSSKNSSFTDNTATGKGGAVYASYEADIEGGSFTGNSAQNGSAVYVGGKGVSAKNAAFTGNTATAEGSAAVYVKNGNINTSLSFSSCHVDNNTGSGLVVDTGSKSITSLITTNSSFDGNTGYGIDIGGFASFDISTAQLGSSSFSGNGKSGIRIDCSNLNNYNEQSSRYFSISGCTVDSNGEHGIFLKDGQNTGSSGARGHTVISSTKITNNGTLVPIGDGATYGGGIYAGVNNSLKMDETVEISGNKATYGGAIYWKDQDSDLGSTGVGTPLRNNQAIHGGAIYADKPVSFSGLVIENNTATYGGGMYIAMDASALAGKQVTIGGSSAFRGNSADMGGAIYIAADKLGNNATAKQTYVNLASAIISGNSSSQSDYYNGIYNAGSRLVMAGDNVNISDNIWLSKPDRHIYLSSSLDSGSYNVAVDLNNYTYGSVVVAPGDVISTSFSENNAAQYLQNVKAVVSGSVFSKDMCGEHDGNHVSVDAIVLKQCVFVDGRNAGLTQNAAGEELDGSTPAKAYGSMDDAIKKAEQGKAVVYICGPITVSGTETWGAGADSSIELRRYSGFAVGGDPNTVGPAFTGDMVTVSGSGSLTIGEGISVIAGRHNDKDPSTPSGSIFEVQTGGELNLDSTLSIEGNNSVTDGGAISNSGTVNVTGAVTLSDNRGVNGGAIYNAGSLNIGAGGSMVISGGAATNGGAIYNTGSVEVKGKLLGGSASLTVSGSTASVNGASVYNVGSFTVHSGDSLSADNEFYLANNAVLTLEDDKAEVNGNGSGSPLLIDIGDPRDGRIYVSYQGGNPDAATVQAYYTLTPAVDSSFQHIAIENGNGLNLQLSQSNVVYLNQRFTGPAPDGLDEGISADYPYRTLEAAYTALKDTGGLIYLVDTYQISDNVTLSADGINGNQIITTGGVSFRRYSQPAAYADYDSAETNRDTERGFNTASNTGALFSVTGSLTLDGVTLDGHNYDINNAGENTQFTVADAVTATAPLVEVTGSGSLTLKNGASLVNNTNSGIEGDSGIVSGHAVSFAGNALTIGSAKEGESVTVNGSVYLAADEFITVKGAGYVSPASGVHVSLSDAYDGRVIASYDGGEPAQTELDKYSLDKAVSDFYKLAVSGNHIILRTNRAIYVDGKSGNNNYPGTPDQPLRTLKEAYTKLSGHGGTIYIVNTVTVGSSMTLSPTQYIDSADTINIAEGIVQLRRYSRPDAADTIPGYQNAQSNTNALIEISNGASLNLNGLTIDGHNQPMEGSQTIKAPAVDTADAALILVRGSLTVKGGSLQNNTNTAGNGGALRVYGTGSVSLSGGAALTGNQSLDSSDTEDGIGNGVFLAGTLDVSGSVSFGADQFVFLTSNTKHVDVSGALTGAAIPVQLNSNFVDYGTVVGVYSASQPDASDFVLGSANNTKMTALGYTLGEKGQNVLILASYAVNYTLTGLEPIPNAHVEREQSFSFTLVPKSGYALPLTNEATFADNFNITRTRITGYDETTKQAVTTNETLTLGSDYSYNSSTGVVTVNASAVTGDITVTVTGTKVHAVNYVFADGTNGIVENSLPGYSPTSVRSNQGFTALFKAAEGYELPTVTSVTMNGAGIDYTDVAEGDVRTLTVADNIINADVTVNLSAVRKSYPVTNTIEGLAANYVDDTANDGNVTADGRVYHDAPIVIKLALDEPDGYDLPVGLTVEAGGQPLEAAKLNDISDGDYYYDKNNGTLTIKAGVIKGEVIISGQIIPKTFTVSTAGISNLTVSELLGVTTDDKGNQTVKYKENAITGTLTANTGYDLPASLTVTIGEQTYTVTGSSDGTADANGFVYNSTTGAFTIPQNMVTGDISLTAMGRQFFTVTYEQNPAGTVTFGSETAPAVVKVYADAANFAVAFGIATGYEAKANGVTVTMGGEDITANTGVYTPEKSDVAGLDDDVIGGSIEIATVTGNVVISVETESRRYPVIHDDDNSDLVVKVGDTEQNDNSVEHAEENVTIVIDPKDGYDPPAAPTVTVITPEGDKPLTKDTDYTYTVDETTGVGTITITNPDVITGPIVIEGASEKKTYDIDVNIANAASIVKPDKATHGEEVEITVNIPVSHNAPTDLEVKIVDPSTGAVLHTLTAGDGYSYADGVITVDAEIVVGKIVITGTATIKNFTVQYVIAKDTVGEGRPMFVKNSGVDSIDYGQTLTATFTLNPGYENPIAKVETEGANSNANYWTNNGTVTVNNVTDNVVITLIATHKSYSVDTFLVNVSITLNGVDDENKVKHTANDITGTVTPATGYERPDSISVTYDDGTAVEGVTYNSTTGEFTIPAQAVTGDINISVNGVPKTYDVTTDLNDVTVEFTNGVKTEGNKQTTQHQQSEIIATLTPATGHDLPDEITVTIGGTEHTVAIEDGKTTGTVTIDDDDSKTITYNKSTGTVTISQNAVTGDVNITVDGAEQTYTVTYNYLFNNVPGSYGTPTEEAKVTYPSGYSSAISANPGYRITGIKVEMNGADEALADIQNITGSTTFDDDSIISGSVTDNEDFTALTLTLAEAAITGNVTVTISTTKRLYTVSYTDELNKTSISSDDDKDANTDGIQLEHHQGEGEAADVTITINPETGYLAPDNITVTVKDPDGDSSKDKTLTEDDYTYTVDETTGVGTITILVPITGPVEINTNSTLKTFAVTENVAKAKVKDVTKTPAEGEEYPDVPESGNADAHKVSYGEALKLQIEPDYGHSLPDSITVTIGETPYTIEIPKDETTGAVTIGNAEDGKTITYDKTTGTVTISEGVITGEVTISGTCELTVYDVEYLLKDDEGNQHLSVPEEYDDDDDGGKDKANLPVHGEQFVTYIVPNEGIVLPDEITITMGSYTDENGEEHTSRSLRAKAEGDDKPAEYSYEIITDEDGNKQGEITIFADVIKADITINAVGISTFDISLDNVTLTAVADESRLVAGKTWKTETRNLLNFEDEDGGRIITMERLKGKTFTIEAVTVKNVTLTAKDNIIGTTGNVGTKFTAGSNYSDSTFGLTLKLNNGSELDVAENAAFSFGANDTAADLTFTLYNANALTDITTARSVTLELKSSAGDIINVTVDINVLATQINVTVPLVLVLKTNIDGGSASIADKSYSIENKSFTPVQLTGIDLEPGEHSGDGKPMSPAEDNENLLNVRDKYRVSFKEGSEGQTLDADTEKSQLADKADSYNPIASVATSPLTFVTNIEEGYGVHMATVNYTVEIPTEDAK